MLVLKAVEIETKEVILQVAAEELSELNEKLAAEVAVEVEGSEDKFDLSRPMEVLREVLSFYTMDEYDIEVVLSEEKEVEDVNNFEKYR